MTIEIVDFPIKNGDFPVRYVKLGIHLRHIFESTGLSPHGHEACP